MYTACNVLHSLSIVTTSTTGNDFSTSANDAYGVIQTATTCEGAVTLYEEVATTGTVERIYTCVI